MHCIQAQQNIKETVDEMKDKCMHQIKKQIFERQQLERKFVFFLFGFLMF